MVNRKTEGRDAALRRPLDDDRTAQRAVPTKLSILWACALRSACIVLIAPMLGKTCGAEQYDFSSPTSAFRSLGSAIKNNHPESVYKGVVLGNPPMSYAVFLEKIWDSQNAEYPGFDILSKAARSSGSAATFFATGEILAEKTGWGEENGMRHQVLVVRWKQSRVMREENLFLLPGEKMWRWCPDPNGSNYPIYDATTAKHVYLALVQSLRLRLVEQLCEFFATSVRGGLSVKECVRILAGRLSQLPEKAQRSKWTNPAFRGSGEQEIEEEMLPRDGSSRVLCRVWRVSVKDRKRIDHELFIKEGNEWKWLPKPESFWNPTKAEPKR